MTLLQLREERVRVETGLGAERGPAAPCSVFLVVDWLLLGVKDERFERLQHSNEEAENLAGQRQDVETCWNQLQCT